MTSKQKILLQRIAEKIEDGSIIDPDLAGLLNKKWIDSLFDLYNNLGIKVPREELEKISLRVDESKLFLYVPKELTIVKLAEFLKYKKFPLELDRRIENIAHLAEHIRPNVRNIYDHGSYTILLNGDGVNSNRGNSTLREELLINLCIILFKRNEFKIDHFIYFGNSKYKGMSVGLYLNKDHIKIQLFLDQYDLESRGAIIRGVIKL